jgi:hypothetical protein
MSSVHVYNELKNFLTTEFPGDNVIDVDTINVTLQQSKNRFICIEEVSSNNVIVGFGDPTGGLCIREISGLVVHAFVPAPESSATARSFAEAIHDKLVLRTLNGVNVYDVDPPEMEVLNDGLWSTSTVTLLVTYDRHIVKP